MDSAQTVESVPTVDSVLNVEFAPSVETMESALTLESMEPAPTLESAESAPTVGTEESVLTVVSVPTVEAIESALTVGSMEAVQTVESVSTVDTMESAPRVGTEETAPTVETIEAERSMRSTLVGITVESVATEEAIDGAPEIETDIITETVETIGSAPSKYVDSQPVTLTNLKPLQNTFSDGRLTSFVEATPSAFVPTFMESRVSPYNDTQSSTFIESAASSFTDSPQTSYMDSAPSTYNDSMAVSYSESRLQEAELIINLSSRNRRSLANPTLTQVNTSIGGSDSYVPSLTDTSTNISISETFVNPMPNLGDASTSIEVQTDHEVVDTVSGNEHDPILEENTIAIMGQVTSSNSGLLNETSESTSGRSEESVSANEIDPNNVIVISMIDANADQEKKKSGMKSELVGATEGEPTPEAIFVPSTCSSGKGVPPVPMSLVMNTHRLRGIMNKDKLKGPEEPEITIERKKFHECLVCKAKFKSIMDLFRHRVEHNESMKSMFKCDTCSLTFEDPVELEKHKLAAHSAKRVYRCSICQDTFTLLHNYKCHLRIHNNIGPYVCNMCYRVFDKKAKFISHMDDHEFAATNPYRHRLQCNVCDKIFSEAGKLKRHSLIHTAKREHKCHICEKEFFERHKLSRHMLSHSGKREYPCPECDKAFTLKHNLTIHMRIHENLRPYQCLVCKRTFIQKIVLQRHLRIHQDYLLEQSQKFSRKYVS